MNEMKLDENKLTLYFFLSWTDFSKNDDFFGERSPKSYRHPIRHDRPRHFEPTFRGQARAELDDSEPKSFFKFTEDLLPDLETVVRPRDWNVHDFGTWEEYFGKNFESTKVSDKNPQLFEAFLTIGIQCC